MRTVHDVRKLWVLTNAHFYTTTEAPRAWKSFVRECKKARKTPDEVCEWLEEVYEYQRTH